MQCCFFLPFSAPAALSHLNSLLTKGPGEQLAKRPFYKWLLSGLWCSWGRCMALCFFSSLPSTHTHSLSDSGFRPRLPLSKPPYLSGSYSRALIISTPEQWAHLCILSLHPLTANHSSMLHRQGMIYQTSIWNNRLNNIWRLNVIVWRGACFKVPRVIFFFIPGITTLISSIIFHSSISPSHPYSFVSSLYSSCFPSSSLPCFFPGGPIWAW